MQQICIDICNLPEVDGFKHLVVCIDYYSKWSEAKPIKDKSVSTICQIYLCWNVCIKNQINDQGREFVIDISTVLHNMIGTDQRMPSTYYYELQVTSFE